MRIGVNCYLLQPHIGGLKQYFFALFRELLEQDAENEYVFFWFPHNGGELDKLQSDRWRKNAILLHSQEAIRSHVDKIDLFFCPFGVLYPRPLPIPSVVTLVDIQEKYYPEFFTSEVRYTRDLYFPCSTRIADRVVTISEFSRQSLIQHHRLPAEKVIVSHLCADQRFYRCTEIARQPANAPARDFIIYPANFWKHKNHDRLLQALRILRASFGLTPDMVFTGFDQQNGFPLRDKIREYGLDSSARVLGYVKVEELAFLYRHARLLVFPSLFEGFGIPLVEAMASGCPVVAANTTCVPEIVQDAARLFDPLSPEDMARAIAAVWQNNPLREAMVERGQRRARDFSAQQMARAHQLAFREAAAAFYFPRYLWNRHVFRYWHRLGVELRWHTPRQCLQLLRRWISERRSCRETAILSRANRTTPGAEP